MTDLVQCPRSTGQVLSECRAVAMPALQEAVSHLPSSMRQVVGYHFGWLDERGDPCDASRGKMIRPALTLLAAAAVGGRPEDALPAAVAVELVHNFSLLHDDVMDRDRLRHHRSTVWAVFGIPTAVLAGDALLALALRVLRECEHDAADDAARALSVALDGLMRGQTADLDFERRDQVGLAECLQMVAGKTGALLGSACAVGALLGGGSREQVDRLTVFGRQLGVAFQFVDDLLGIWGRPTVTGKPVRSDLAHRKRSLPVVYALASNTEASTELAELYQLRRPLTSSEVDHAAGLVERAGARIWAEQEAGRLVRQALDHLHAADPRPEPAAELAGLAALIARRDS